MLGGVQNGTVINDRSFAMNRTEQQARDLLSRQAEAQHARLLGAAKNKKAKRIVAARKERIKRILSRADNSTIPTQGAEPKQANAPHGAMEGEEGISKSVRVADQIANEGSPE